MTLTKLQLSNGIA